ncbi:MAG TPA: hypothetical protein VGP82_15675 [Ktedonobacterales bacterium]|jgi:hypothetical protein|nr:hypothetical protein [Ktedonobacterales bacterium]
MSDDVEFARWVTTFVDSSAGDDAALHALVDPPAYCPGCVAAAGQECLERATSRLCARCLGMMRRVYQCRLWNGDPAHQRQAGHAIWAIWAACSARWRAASGLVPLAVETVRRYLTPEHMRGPLGALLPTRARGGVSGVVRRAAAAG